jgi:hypothetical protein
MTNGPKPAFGQPALVGGLVMGVLSALPLVGPVGNACCCLWVVSGGLAAAYVLQQNHPAPIAPGDGALVGLLAGLMGAGVHFAVSIPLDLLLGPMERSMALRFIERMPPDMRDTFDQLISRSGQAQGAFFILGHLVGLVVWAFAGGIFGTLGGVIGAAVFKKSAPPGGTFDAPPA